MSWREVYRVQKRKDMSIINNWSPAETVTVNGKCLLLSKLHMLVARGQNYESTKIAFYLPSLEYRFKRHRNILHDSLLK